MTVLEPARLLAQGLGSARAALEQLGRRLLQLAAEGTADRRRLVLAAPARAAPDPASATESLWSAGLLRNARVARELAHSFPGAEPPIELPGGWIGALVGVDEAYEANLLRASIAIGRIEGVPRSHVAGIGIPTAADDVPDFLAAL